MLSVTIPSISPSQNTPVLPNIRRIVTRPSRASCSRRNSAKSSLATMLDPPRQAALSLLGRELADDPASEMAHPGRQPVAVRIDQVKAVACIDRLLERLYQIALAQVVFHEPAPAEHNTQTIERRTEGQIGAGKGHAPCERQ